MLPKIPANSGPLGKVGQEIVTSKEDVGVTLPTPMQCLKLDTYQEPKEIFVPAWQTVQIVMKRSVLLVILGKYETKC